MHLIRIAILLMFFFFICRSPYQESKDHHPFPGIAFFTGCIKCMDIVEPYHLERVLWQVDRVQIIPPLPIPPSHYRRGYNAKQYRLSYNSVDHFWERWRNYVWSEEEKSMPVTYQWEAIDQYTDWYLHISHSVIQNLAHWSAGAEIQAHATDVAPNILAQVKYSIMF